MKLATFKIKATGMQTFGVFDGREYLDVVALGGGAVPGSLLELLMQDAAGLERVRSIAESARGPEHRHAPSAVELLSPITRPGKIIHTACNFDAHLNELKGWQAPEWQEHNWGDFHFEHPTGFLQAGNCVTGSGTPVSAPPFTRQLDYEIEVGIVIGRPAYQVKVEDALGYVAGLAVFNDLSARDIQAREHSNKVILLGKSFKGSCPLGPWLVTLDEIADPDNLEMKLYLNGELRQDSSTRNMHYKVAELVSWWSNMPLEPGDIITTGSPPGVISGMKNPQWLKPGDVVEAKVESLGTLVTPIA